MPNRIDDVDLPAEVKSGKRFTATISWTTTARRKLRLAAETTGFTAELVEDVWLNLAETGESKEFELIVTRDNGTDKKCEVRFSAFTNDVLESVKVE